MKAGHDVRPLPTPGAERFVAAETFFALARREQSTDPYPHLQHADLLAIAPLTANTLAKLAHGLADNVLTEAALAHDGPVLVAPAMNTRMWEHPAVAANIETLRGRGVEIVGPDSGELAEGEIGAGRMAEPEAICARIEQLLAPGGGRWAPRQAHPRVRRRHARAAGQRSLPRQPLVGPDGGRDRRRGAEARRGCDAARGQPRRAAAGRCVAGRDADRRRRRARGALTP